MRVLIVAPHHDDEVFGPGATIPKYAKHGHEVHVLVMATGDDLFDQDLIKRIREESYEAHRILGVSKTHYADLPSIKLDTFPQYQINDLLLRYFRDIKPQILFIPFPGDVNRDHQIVHACSMVAARPISVALEGIYCYEAVSSTNWNSPGIVPTFTPNTFVDVTDTIQVKIEAAQAYGSQLKEHPHERSVENIMALARYRGGFINISYAEAFMCIRQILL
jgi:LmbE family N-acetylglucosaminyl deacetylase